MIHHRALHIKILKHHSILHVHRTHPTTASSSSLSPRSDGHDERFAWLDALVDIADIKKDSTWILASHGGIFFGGGCVFEERCEMGCMREKEKIVVNKRN